MSSKQSTSKVDPRIAKREAMVTRHKSAQMKRQLRNKDRSMKHITDLLKSPTRENHTVVSKNVPVKSKTSPELKQSLLKSVEKVQNLPKKVFKLSKVLRKKIALVHDEEFYPNKKKRKMAVQKVVLKPSQELRMVGGMTGSVKRKSRVPHKATSTLNNSPVKTSSPAYTELSMAEVIRIVEDDLTDEDMMEILTCPSPVWWEDPPDGEYIEDAILTRLPPHTRPDRKTKKKAKDKMHVDGPATIQENVKDPPIEISNLDARGDKFLKKRSTLEGLLSNIKNKGKAHNNEKDVFNEDVAVISSNHRKLNKEVNKVVKLKQNSEEAKKHAVSESDGDEILLHDSSLNEDELLRDLENMDIPIEDQTRQPDVIVIDDDDDDHLDSSKEKTGKAENGLKELKTSKRKTKPKNYSKGAPKIVPALKKGKNKFSSPKSSDSSSSKSSKNQDIDSISDTNITFILDDDLEENEKNICSDFSVKEESQKIETSGTNLRDNGTTMYNIITEMSNNFEGQNHTETLKDKTSLDNKEDKTGVINEYYKNCKKVYVKKSKRIEPDKTDINKNDLPQDDKDAQMENISHIFMSCDACKPKTKKVSDDKNVKYCLKCSSIFDSTDCTYCLEKTKSKVYMCFPCKMKFCCEDYYKVHAVGHKMDLVT